MPPVVPPSPSAAFGPCYPFLSWRSGDFDVWVFGTMSCQIHAPQFTELHQACLCGALGKARGLVKDPGGGDYLNTKDDQGNTPLYLACVNGHDKLTQFLLSEGAAVNPQNLEGFTARMLTPFSFGPVVHWWACGVLSLRTFSLTLVCPAQPTFTLPRACAIPYPHGAHLFLLGSKPIQPSPFATLSRKNTMEF